MPGVQLALGQGTEKTGRALVLRGTRVLIGRTERCTVRLVEEFVPVEHAALVLDSETWYVRDLGGPAGTFLNGVRVTTASVAAGDIVGIGRDGAEIQILEVDPPSEVSRSVPVHDPVRPPPPRALVGPTGRGAAWPGVLALLVVVGVLIWLGSRGGFAGLPGTRAETPAALFDLYLEAVRSGNHLMQYDLAGPRYRAVLAELNDATPGRSFRRSLAAEKPRAWTGLPADRAWAEFLREELDAGGDRGVLLVLDPSGREQRVAIVRVDGAWRVAYWLGGEDPD